MTGVRRHDLGGSADRCVVRTRCLLNGTATTSAGGGGDEQ